MSLVRMAIAAGALAFLAGCASTVPLQRAQLNAISRDAPPAAVEQALGKATPTAQFEYAVDNGQLLVRQYLLQTGTRQEMTMVCTTFCFPVMYDIPILTQYLLLQRLPSRSLYAWGTIEELSKDTDPAVSSMMPGLKVRLEEEVKAAKEKKK